MEEEKTDRNKNMKIWKQWKRFFRGTVLGIGLVLWCSGCKAGSTGSQNHEEPKKVQEEMIESVLPRKYDARDHGKVSPVKDQGTLGTCWAFASLQALESSLRPEEAFDFSEDHMSHNPHFFLEQEMGGDYIMSMAYLLSWQGPVLESEDPYGDGISPDNLTASKHVQEIHLLPSRDWEKIKQAVYTGGGVQSAIYTALGRSNMESGYYNRETNSYYYPEETAPNHDVVIVGWDDDYPAENFLMDVPGNGAFLCENSWGQEFGKNGFFYVSYYDKNLGKTNIQYVKTEAADNYDKIYQSDLCGWVGQAGYGQDTVWAVNVYEAGDRKEFLEAAGFYAIDRDTEYEVYLVRNVPESPGEKAFSERKKLAEGYLADAGYYTISFEKPQLLLPGERFGVMIKITTPGAVHPIAVEYDTEDGKSQIDLLDGEGYISPDGEQWEQTEKTQNCNLCLKAYTKLGGQSFYERIQAVLKQRKTGK